MDEPSAASSRHRRRVAALVIAVSLVAAIAVVWTSIALRHHGNPAAATGPSGPHGTSTAAGSPGTSPSPSRSPSPAPPAAPTPRLAACSGSQFTATVGSSGGNAAQRYVVISLLNKSGAGCDLSGYPRLGITARSTSGVIAMLSTSVHHGSVAGLADPAPQRVAVGAGASASFVLGVPDSAGAHQYSISQLRVSLPGDSVSIPVYLSLTGSTRARQPMRLTVTAFVAGANGPP